MLCSIRHTLSKVLELSGSDDDGEAIDEAQHDGMRHHTDKLAEAEGREQKLKDAGKENGCKEVVDTMLDDERGGDDGHGSSRPRDHARAATQNGSNEAKDKGCVKAIEWVDVRHERETDNLRHKRQSRRKACEDLRLDGSDVHFVLLSANLRASARGRKLTSLL